jgi:serine/threonine-protein kinase
MTPDRWHRVESLFEQALDLKPDEREAFLERACRGADGRLDPSLVDEVRSLLSATEDAGDFLGGAAAEAVPGRAARGMLDAASTALDVPPDRVGPYRVLGLLGRGGMGAVYRAERADGAFEQTVALKLVHQGLPASARRRFLAERQILARLEHPGIARLLDGGLLPDGRPYFAMELVEGEPITEYCDHHRLSLRERLALFADVADAVQHAHRNLIVHRDLKPSNILVTADRSGGTPRVKLLDFGIAKLLNPDLVPQTVALTQDGALLLTPEYAAPEQVLGQAITTATDVYQLGVVLFELLAGRKPYRVPTGGTRRAVEEAVLHGQPLRPSTAALRPRSDDTIVVAGNASSRTGPATEEPVPAWRARWARRISGDLDRICLKALRKEPERRYDSAGSLSADLRRFLDGKPVTAQRDTFAYRLRTFARRRPTATLGAVAFLLLLLGYAVTVTVQAREIAHEREVARAEALKAEQVTAFVTDLFYAADPHSAALRGIDARRGVTARELLDRGFERASALDEQPAVQAQLYDVMARTYLGIGENEAAVEPAQRALALQQRLHTTPHPDLAAAHATVGAAAYGVGDPAGAESAYQKALAMAQDLPGTDPEQVAGYHNQVAIAQATLARHEEAERHYAAALAIYREENPDEVPIILHNLGSLHHHLGELAEAERYFEESIALRRRRAGLAERESDRTGERVWLAQSLSLLGPVLRDAGRLEEAASALEESRTIYERLFPPNHDRVQGARLNHASVLVVQGRMQEAAELLEPIVANRTARLGAGHWQTASAAAWLGGAYTGLGRFAEAEPLLLGALDVIGQMRGDRDRYVLEIRAGLARLYAAWGRPADAARYAEGLPARWLEGFPQP